MAHTNGEANLTLEVKRSNVNNHFSNFGRSPVPHNLCKDEDLGLIWLWRRKFLKVFTIYGHDQWTIPILAIFHSPAHGGSA